MRNPARLGVVCLASLAVTAAAAQEGKTFVVLDLLSPPVMRNLGRTLSISIAAEAKEQGATVIDSRGLIDLVGRTRAEEAMNCGIDPECLADKLQGVAAQRVVSGTFNKTQSHYQVRLVHVDLASQQVVSKVERDILIASRALAKDVKSAAPDLLKGEPEKVGKLVVRSDVAGATVTVDGKVRGKTPEVVVMLKPGKHELTVKRESYLPVERFVQIEADETTEFAAELFLIPGQEEPLVVAEEATAAAEAPVETGLTLPLPTWIAGGVALAATGGGVAFGLRARSIEKEAVDLSPRDGVLDVTRSRVLSGKSSARSANLMFVGAGAAAIAAVVMAVVLGEGGETAPPEKTATVGAMVTPDGAVLAVGGRF